MVSQGKWTVPGYTESASSPFLSVEHDERELTSRRTRSQSSACVPLSYSRLALSVSLDGLSLY